MTKVLDWNSNRDMWIRVLKQQTDQNVDFWNQRVRKQNPSGEKELRAWLTEQGVTGYAANLLVMERFGYPDFVTTSADDLLENQYADRPHLRPIYEAIIEAMAGIGEFSIQMRKSYVSLVTPRRTFARVKPSTKKRVDLGLRLAGRAPEGRLRPCKFQETMRVMLSLTSVAELDTEALDWLRTAYQENCD